MSRASWGKYLKYDSLKLNHKVNPKTTPSKTIPDEEILELLNSKILTVNLETTEVKYKGRKKPPFATPQSNTTNRYKIHLYLGNSRRPNYRRRTISLARLVYLAGTLKIIPDGHEIHHLDEDSQNDRFSNLICLSKEDHDKLHAYEEEQIPF